MTHTQCEVRSGKLKIAHLTLEGAEVHAAHLNAAKVLRARADGRAFIHVWHPYECEICGFFHIGHGSREAKVQVGGYGREATALFEELGPRAYHTMTRENQGSAEQRVKWLLR